MNTDMKFGHQIDRYFDNIIKDIERLIAIPSICSPPSDKLPFGKDCADALDCILTIAGELGLDTENVDYYAGEARYGTGCNFVDVLTHVDVVPPGDGWDTNPYKAVRKNDFLYGRGTADNKGAAVVALYCLKALKDAGLKGNYCLRAVFGCGEEIGSNDLDVYYSRRGFPVMGFTPDCAYGICSSEKGILRVDFIAPHHSDCVIKSFHSGTAVNAVPNTATAELDCSLHCYSKLLSLTKNQSNFEVSDFHINADKINCTFTIKSLGKAAHGAEPELGLNAASKLIELLNQLSRPGEIGPLFTFAAEQIGMEFSGSSLGIQMEDEDSGVLTFNLGIVSSDEKKDLISVDIRYPVTASKAMILSQLQKTAAQYKVAVKEVNAMAPLHIPKDSLLVSTLAKAYEAVTGDTCNIYSTGGGTYARHADNRAAAFGPTFAAEPSRNAHGPNEHIELTYFRQHARVCLEAMYRLFTAPCV